MGQTFYISTLTIFYSQVVYALNSGYIFGLMDALAKMGPVFIGIIGEARGGFRGAEKAAKAIFDS